MLRVTTTLSPIRSPLLSRPLARIPYQRIEPRPNVWPMLPELGRYVLEDDRIDPLQFPTPSTRKRQCHQQPRPSGAGICRPIYACTPRTLLSASPLADSDVGPSEARSDWLPIGSNCANVELPSWLRRGASQRDVIAPSRSPRQRRYSLSACRHGSCITVRASPFDYFRKPSWSPGSHLHEIACPTPNYCAGAERASELDPSRC